MKVFISSVFHGLERLREELIRKLQTAGDTPVAMEVFGARPETPLETCLSELRSADLAIVVIGPRYGSDRARDDNAAAGSGRPVRPGSDNASNTGGVVVLG